MKAPVMPERSAEEDPEAWASYWSAQEIYEIWARQENARLYRQRYYKRKTELRRIEKMKELMRTYPDEAREFLEKGDAV